MQDISREEIWLGDVEQPSYQQYPLIYNLLYAKGRYPNVKFIRYAGERSVESTIRHRTLLYAKYLEITPAIEEKIREHVLTKAVQGKGKRESVSAVIWWNVQEVRLERNESGECRTGVLERKRCQSKNRCNHWCFPGNWKSNGGSVCSTRI